MISIEPNTARTTHRDDRIAWLAPILGSIVWIAAYWRLPNWASSLTNLLPLTANSRTADAIGFFLYEVPKVLLLLVLIVFWVGVVQTFFSPERTRSLLRGRREGVGNVMAATLGIVTPFCSCSAVPLFIGFLTAGVPLGVTFSFLVSAPMVNEVALALLFGLFGWRIALLYLSLGLLIAVASGLIISRFRVERLIEPWVFDLPRTAAGSDARMPWARRFRTGWTHVSDIVLKVAPYIIVGVAVGAGIHGYVPQNFMAHLMGKSAWWSVPLAVLIGVPVYSNAAGIIPIVQALLGKGAALGTTLAFMMSVTALSAPEFMILKKVMRPRLIVIFAGVVSAGIILVGYVFNLIV